MTESPSGYTPGAPAGPRAPSPLDYLSTILSRWRVVAACAASAAVVVLLLTFILKGRWTAEVIFLPVSNSASPVQSALGSLAGDLGVILPGGSPTDAPEFYVALLDSRQIMEDILTTRYQLGPDSLPLLDILEIDGDTPAARLEKGRDKLATMYSASSDRTTKVVTVTVTAPDPSLAAQIADRFVKLADRFNKDNRESQASETRRFVEGRLAETDKALRDAEDALEAFHTRNRRFDTPELQTQEARLQRQVQIQQTLYIGLRQQYETARIQEVNDTPVLSVVEAPSPPVRPSFPRRLRLTALALVLGGLLGIGVAVAQSLTANLRATKDPGYDRLVRSWRGMWSEIRQLARRRPRPDSPT